MMRSSLHHCICLLLFALFAQQYAEATITIQTNDGRELSGVVDDRTSDESLWIRQEGEQIVLSTSVRWSSIVAATVNGEAVEVAQLANKWSQLTTTGPTGLSSMPFVIPSSFEQPVHQLSEKVRIRSIEIDAVLVNLDRDVEPDGFELAISAIDHYGHSVPVRGNIYARLIGQRELKRRGGVRFDRLQSWSQRVHPKDFHEGVAIYPLRFRTVRPEFDWELIPIALMNVRLGIPGQGNYEASVPVEIREFNPFRDQLQKFERSRFFSDELSEQVRRRRIAPIGSGLQTWSPR